jgi:hypothetical protein
MWEKRPDIRYIHRDVPEPGFCDPAGTGYYRIIMSAIRPEPESAGCGKKDGYLANRNRSLISGTSLTIIDSYFL